MKITVYSWTFQVLSRTRYWWLTPVILVTQEAEIWRIKVQSQPETLSQKNPSQKKAGRVAQGVSLKFKHPYCQKNNPNKQKKPRM
jgi:hypothetical protein